MHKLLGRVRLAACSLAFFVIHTIHADSLTGLVDTTFNPELQAPTQVGFVFDMAAQPDGKTVIFGDFEKINGAARTNFARLNTDGTFDPTFEVPPLSIPTYEISKILATPDNKLLVAGRFQTFANTTRFNLVRLNQNGSIDAGFQLADKPTILGQFGPNINDLLLQPDGAIVIAGDFQIGSATAIARLSSNGALDTSFNPAATGVPAFYAIARQDDGKILAGAQDRIFRFNTDGSLDTTFSNASRPSGGARSLAIQSDQKILAAAFSESGYTTPTGPTSLIRLNTNGALDTTFAPSPAGSGNFILRGIL